MFYISETEEQLKRLELLSRFGAFVYVIPSNFEYHPRLTNTTAVYIRPLNSQQGFIIPVDHSEGFNIGKERLSQLLSKYNKLYTVNKKELLYHFNTQHSIDLSLLYSMTKYDKLEYTQDLSVINFYYSKYSSKDNVNKMIPISKLYEMCEMVYDKVKEIIEYEIPEGFDYYNTTATNVFYLIEQSGLNIFYEPFIESFKPKNPLYNIQDNTVLTYYNLYNATSRPTNSYNSINFAAIPHTERHRKTFRPQNDYFVEFDFDGYHIRLLCEQIGYDLTEESAHKQLAKLYFEKEDITDEEYNDAKQINFHALYGKIPEKYAFLEVFEKIDSFIKNLWKEYKKNKIVFDPISKKPFTTKLKDMNPQKLMNYLMQSLETSRNIAILKKVLRFLKDKKTKVVLYTYDSIILDFSKEDSKTTLEDLKIIMQENNKYPVKFKYSKNLVL